MDTSVTLIEFDYFSMLIYQSNLISLPSKHHLKQNTMWLVILDQIFVFPLSSLAVLSLWKLPIWTDISDKVQLLNNSVWYAVKLLYIQELY